MKMKEEKTINDIEKIKHFLLALGFVCNSHPTARHLIYTKAGETVVIKNNKTKEK